MFKDFDKFLFGNIGKVIKKIAKIECYSGMFCSIIGGLILFFIMCIEKYVAGILISLLVIIIGPIISYIGSIFIYAFGVLVESNQKLAQSNIYILKHIKNIDNKQIEEF